MQINWFVSMSPSAALDMTQKREYQKQTIVLEVVEAIPRSIGPKSSFYDMVNVVVG